MNTSLPSNQTGGWIRPGLVSNLPNALSLFRLLGAPVLLALAITGWERTFRWLLVVCLVSDIADGLIARRFGVATKLGARLDSTADLGVSAVATFGVFWFRPEFVAGHYLGILLVIAFYLAAVAAAFWRYGRPASFHTTLSRVAAYAQGIFVVLLLFRGYEAPLFYLMIGISLTAYVEELILTWLLGAWTPDVGGLYRVLRRDRS